MNHKSSLPSIEGLQAVLAAHAVGSFSAAASELGVTHGAISRRIGVVETWAGIRLFERHGRGVRLTLEGQRFAGLVQQALEVIGSASDPGQRKLDVVRINVLPSFARLWLLPNLRHLEGSPADMRLELEAEHRFADLERVDVAIRYGPGGWRDGIATPLFAETLVPAASPGLAKHLGGTAPAKAILRHPLIYDAYPDSWRLWLRDQGHDYRARPQDRCFPDYDLVLEAGAAGHGIVLMRQPYGNAYIKDGRLRLISKASVPNRSQCYALTRPGAARRSVQLLISRLAALSTGR